MTSRMLAVLAFASVSGAMAAAHDQQRLLRGGAVLASGLRPDLVARTFVSVMDDWKAQAGLFVNCNIANGAACSDARDSYLRSCSKVTTSIVSGSDGDRDVMKEYMEDVCGQQVLIGWRQERCVALKDSVDKAMTDDSYINREDFHAEKSCSALWTKLVDDERKREEREAAERAEEEKKAAEEAKKRAEEEEELKKKAEEEAKKKAAEAAKKASEEAKKKAEEAQRKAEEAAKEHAAKQAELAKAKLREAAERLKAKKAEAEAVARAAQKKMEEAEAAEQEHRKLLAKANLREKGLPDNKGEAESPKTSTEGADTTKKEQATHATHAEEVTPATTKAQAESSKASTKDAESTEKAAHEEKKVATQAVKM